MSQTAENSSTAVATPTSSSAHNAEVLSKFRRIGVTSWSAIGVILLAVLIAGGISALSSILVPLVIAIILGTVLEPVVAWLVRHKMPRTLAAALTLTAALAIAVGVVYVAVYGFIQQIPDISRQLLNGWGQAMAWLHSLNLDPSWLEQMRTSADDLVSRLGYGAFGAVTGALTGTIMMSVGAFFAIYFLFFVLRDGRLFPGWLARVTTQDETLVAEIDAQVRRSIRGYFSGTALTALITGPIFVLPLFILGIPLVIPMIVLYFFLSFIPYIGAWVTGAFAVLIAFGFGGPSAALIVGLALLVSNGPVQNAVLSWALGSSLKIHPVMVLLATIIGGIVAGILGMVLGPPVMSALQQTLATLRRHRNGELDEVTARAESTDADTEADLAADTTA